jgi:tetratricopeptide (TPR) repeat protein
MTVPQQNDSCSGCHAKAVPITGGYEAGEQFWNHYDLTTFENADYYSDGRDRGENYTIGSWLLSPCARKGSLGCIHCHTSSGRYRFKGKEANNACLPCHQQRVENAAEHMHHPDGKGATECVQCHMPMTPFAGMNQTDHSMRPPMPDLSKAVGSRNACVMCHKDKDNDWALGQIRSWHRDFDRRTAPELHRARLVEALRKGDLQQLPATYSFIADPASDPLFVTTLIRLLPPSDDPQQKAILRELLGKATHPLVRSAAATALDADNNPADRKALFSALTDGVRLVRIRAAERLAALPQNDIPAEYRKAFDAAVKEMWDSINLRMDHWSAPFNAGNIFMRQKRFEEAAGKYDRAHELRNDIAPPLINGAMAFANIKKLPEAESRLKKATALPEPSAEAHFNLGLLYAEQGRTARAEAELYHTLELSPQNAAAACNLAILIAGRDYPETFRLLQNAILADPHNPRYVQTLAFYYLQAGQPDLADKVIRQAAERGVSSPDIEALRRQIR